MSEYTHTYESILSQYLEWVRGCNDARSVVVVGSRARTDHPADRWADLDIITFTRTPQRYFNESTWIDRFGDVWAKIMNRTAGNEPEWLVCYAGGVDVDFVFNDIRQIKNEVRLLAILRRFPLVRRILPRQTLERIERGRAMGAATFARGIRIEMDKDGLLQRLAELLGPPPLYQAPSEREFSRLLEKYWLLVERIAKKICRGELTVALGWMNGLNRSSLLPLIEWHAHAARGSGIDTWHAGRFLEEWADPRVVAVLPDVYAPYEQKGAWAALIASMDLVDWLAVEISAQYKFLYPDPKMSSISPYIRTLVEADHS